MKIGVYTGEILPQIGGSFIVPNELFKALLQLARESRHTFVVFGKSEYPPAAAKNIQFITLRRSLIERLAPGDGPLERIIRKLHRTTIMSINPDKASNASLGIRDSYEKIIMESGVEMFWFMYPYCLTMEIPYMLTYFDLQHRLQPYFPEVSLRGEWNKREMRYEHMLRRASFVITGTQTAKSEIEYFYQVPPERIKVLPLPTPQFALDAAPCSSKEVLGRYNIPENYIFYPAQFWPHKNHACLLRALRFLQDEWGLAFHAVFSGSDQGNRSYIERLTSELNLLKQVHFLGFVPQQDLMLLYQNALALVFPSFFGPDNFPPLEAFALGCPVIAANVPGAQEQLGDAVLLADPKDPQEFAAAIRSVYGDSGLRQRLLLRGLERARKWTPRDYVRGIFSILDDFQPIRSCWGRKF